MTYKNPAGRAIRLKRGILMAIPCSDRGSPFAIREVLLFLIVGCGNAVLVCKNEPISIYVSSHSYAHWNCRKPY